jgi:hypothetical protein
VFGFTGIFFLIPKSLCRHNGLTVFGSGQRVIFDYYFHGSLSLDILFSSTNYIEETLKCKKSKIQTQSKYQFWIQAKPKTA